MTNLFDAKTPNERRSAGSQLRGVALPEKVKPCFEFEYNNTPSLNPIPSIRSTLPNQRDQFFQ